MLRPCKSDPVFLSDNYRSYFVGHLNIVIKILVYSKIINKIFNFTSNFKVGLTHEKFQFVHASCTLIIFFQHFSVLFTREKNVKQRKNYSDYLTAYFQYCCPDLCTYPDVSKMENFILNRAKHYLSKLEGISFQPIICIS